MLDHLTHRFLLQLEKAGDWISIDAVSHIPAHIRSQAVKLGYVEARGANLDRQYRIVKAGYTALADNAHFAMQKMKADGLAAGNGHVEVAEPEIAVVTKPCVEPGCKLPRYKNANRCEQHAKALWREQQRKKNLPYKTNAAALAADEPPIAEDDTERDPVVEDLIVSPFARALAILILAAFTAYYKLKGLR